MIENDKLSAFNLARYNELVECENERSKLRDQNAAQTKLINELENKVEFLKGEIEGVEMENKNKDSGELKVKGLVISGQFIDGAEVVGKAGVYCWVFYDGQYETHLRHNVTEYEGVSGQEEGNGIGIYMNGEFHPDAKVLAFHGEGEDLMAWIEVPGLDLISIPSDEFSIINGTKENKKLTFAESMDLAAANLMKLNSTDI